MKRSMAAAFVVVLATLAVSAQASVAPPLVLSGTASLTSTGYNSLLDASGGKYYIPLQLATSGTLGAPLTPPKRVGLNRDSVRLSLSGTSTSTGTVAFDETFAITEPMDAATAQLKFTFNDMDFLSQSVSGGTLRETLKIIYHPSEGPDITLTLNNSNYTQFRTDGKTKTNNVRVNYYVDLIADLGLDPSDVDDINSGLSMSLSFEVSTILTRTRSGTATYMNSAEKFDAALIYQPGSGTPEPMTMALLVAGLPLVLRRKRK